MYSFHFVCSVGSKSTGKASPAMAFNNLMQKQPAPSTSFGTTTAVESLVTVESLVIEPISGNDAQLNTIEGEDDLFDTGNEEENESPEALTEIVDIGSLFRVLDRRLVNIERKIMDKLDTNNTNMLDKMESSIANVFKTHMSVITTLKPGHSSSMLIKAAAVASVSRDGNGNGDSEGDTEPTLLDIDAVGETITTPNGFIEFEESLKNPKIVRQYVSVIGVTPTLIAFITGLLIEI